ncbi:MAG: hypothetical protein V3S05_06465 [Desulfobacterales bacterium]|jgi:hypothetical protein
MRPYSINGNMHPASIPGAMDRVTAIALPGIIGGITVIALPGAMDRAMVIAATGATAIEDTGGWKKDTRRTFIKRLGIRVIITAMVNGSPDIGL